MKTKQTNASVEEFLAQQAESVRSECQTILGMMERATGVAGKMWGPGIIGFGDYHYKYESGREGDWFEVGFSPRKATLVLYIMPSAESLPDHLARLGKHKTGVSCLYIKRLSDVDVNVLEEMIQEAVKRLRAAGDQ